MTYALVTIAAPLRVEDIDRARALIVDTLGNPASDEIATALRGPHGSTEFVHFASMHALPRGDGKGGHLVFEFSADGTEADALAALAMRVEAFMTPIFALASDWRSSDTLIGYWKRHQVKIGWGLFDAPGLAFAGTPGMSVPRILDEGRLAARAGELLGHTSTSDSALERLNEVRKALAADPQWQWALQPPPPPVQHPKEDPLNLATIVSLLPSFAANFLWPVLLVYGVLALLAGWNAPSIATALWRAIVFAWANSGTLLLVVVAGLIGIYVLFRRAEVRDWTATNSIKPDVLEQILLRENQPGYAQNHMISLTTLKPGFIRQLTIRLAFFVIGKISALNPKPGRLGDIGTIHFARWVTLPGGRDFVFMSNYCGSWESYLEDFITRAHAGLTGVWSNTIGFPRSENLFLEGATDGERFKRFARASMLPTPFWFDAYPDLTTDNVRSNADIRRGIAAALTDQEAIDWLALFASAQRPIDKIESSEVQSIIFGGLGFMPYGTALVMKLGEDRARNKEWLAELLPYVAFNDGRRLKAPAVLTLALGPGGLERLGLPPSAIETFPPAFLQGMTGPGRDRILGDVGANAPAHWWWGREPDHATLLVYGSTPAAATRLAKAMVKAAEAAGHFDIHSIALEPVSPYPGDRREPFGFVDGTSQPVIRGTYRGLRNADPIHLVEPGEFILGYPDNRNNMPPGPHMAAILDPDSRLPIAAQTDGFGENIVDSQRDIGRNGSFLVLRQLEQDVEGFHAYCEAEAKRLQGVLPPPYEVTKEFIAAKMVGRWHDGSSIARHPFVSASEAAARRAAGKGHESARPLTRPASNPGNEAATAIAPYAGAVAEKMLTTQAAAGPKNKTIADNDFLFGAEDSEGIRCPFGAHIRRANPRDSLDPGSMEQVEISNRHRIIRIGRGYKPEPGQTHGLLFMALNGDIERQFEFLQQTWLGNPKFMTLDHEVDPIVVDGSVHPVGHPPTNGFTIPTRDGPIALAPMPRFVTTRGGGYFFLPSRRLLKFLSGAA